MSDDLTVHDQSLQSRVTRPDAKRDEMPVDLGDVFFLHMTQFADELPKWSYWPHRRDRALRQFFKTEPLFASTVYSMMARMKALKLKVTGKRRTMVDDVLRSADFHGGWQQLVAKTIQNLATQDNGAFWELVGAGRGDGPLVGPVRAVESLDPAQCFRTLDAEYPVMYVNPITRDIHRLHHSRVVMFSNMPQPDEMARNIGLCVLSRALSNVQTARAMQRFRHEKITGRFERGIIYGRGVTAKTLDGAFQGKQAENDAIGLTYYGKIPVLISPQGVQLELLDLARLPDGFNLKDDITLYIYAIALAWGVDAREFWPATVTGASKADASVQHMKAMGKGIADYINIIETAFNERVLPPGTTAEFDFIDDEHDRARAEMHRTRINTLSNLHKDGVLPKKIYAATLIDEGIITTDVASRADDILRAVNPEWLEDMDKAEEQAELLTDRLASQSPDQQARANTSRGGEERAEGVGARAENDEMEGDEGGQDEEGQLMQRKTLDQSPFRGDQEPKWLLNGLAAQRERALDG